MMRLRDRIYIDFEISNIAEFQIPHVKKIKNRRKHEMCYNWAARTRNDQEVPFIV